MNDFKYRVTLTTEERERLQAQVSRGKAAARKLARARILLLADEAQDSPARTDEAIMEALQVSACTIRRVRQRCVEQGLAAALEDAPSARVYARKLDGAAEAHVIAAACSTPPEGRKRWTLHLLADRMVALGLVDSICPETVRQALKKTNSSRT